MAALSEVLICNLALTKIGQQRINSLTDSSKSAILCNQVYETLRDEVLEDHPWNFAIKRASFAQLTSVPAYEFAHEYQIPTDCLRVWRPESEDTIFKVEDGKVLCDDDEFKCQYISQVTNPAKFTRNFADALSIRIAAEIAYAIVGSREIQETMYKLYEIRVRMARSNDAQEGTVDDIIQTQFLESRY